MAGFLASVCLLIALLLALSLQITVALLPRIPLYGGWSTDFVYGFEVPLRSFSGRAPDGRKELVYAFAPHVKGLVTDEQVIRVCCCVGKSHCVYQPVTCCMARTHVQLLHHAGSASGGRT
jgi:Ribophorin I